MGGSSAGEDEKNSLQMLAFFSGHIWGDPCEFGLLSVLNSVWSRYPADKYGPHHAQDARLGQGIGTSFVWLAAQAHNQGQGQSRLFVLSLSLKGKPAHPFCLF